MSIQLTGSGVRTLAASLGLKVFPCLPGTKTPAVSHGFKSDDGEIMDAFARSPDAPIALAAGIASDRVVGLDLETEEVARQLFPKLDALLARTWCIRTPHGGVVVLMKAVDRVPARRLRLAGSEHPFDLCGEGGYFLIWGTIDHAKCDAEKTRCPHEGASSYETISFDYQIMEMREVEESLARRCKELGWETDSKLWPSVSKVIRGTTEGSRNRAAFVMARYLLFTQKMPEPDALFALKTWNAQNEPPLDERELESVLLSARNYPKPEVIQPDARW